MDLHGPMRTLQWAVSFQTFLRVKHDKAVRCFEYHTGMQFMNRSSLQYGLTALLNINVCKFIGAVGNTHNSSLHELHDNVLHDHKHVHDSEATRTHITHIIHSTELK